MADAYAPTTAFTATPAQPAAASNTNISHPMQPLVNAWLRKLNLAQMFKDKHFQRVAQECMRFLDGGIRLNDYLWGNAGAGKGGYMTGDENDDIAPPTFRFTMNKVAELCQLFGPMLYNRNPVRTVTPRKFDPVPPGIYAALNPQLFAMAQQSPQQPPPNSPPQVLQQTMMAQQQQQQAIMQLQGMVQQGQQQDLMTQVVDQTRAQLLEEYLNYTPNELNLRAHSRLVVDEALIKGMGVWWTELFQAKGSPIKMVGSFYDTSDYLLLDPDVDLIDECKWIARKCIHPRWEVEELYGLAPGELDKATSNEDTVKTTTGYVTNSADRLESDDHRKGKTNDLVTYWKVYSKMGLGGRMSGMDPDLKNMFDGFGDNVMLVVCDGIPYPLNLPTGRLAEAPQVQDPQATQQWISGIQQSLQWPIPFWADGKSWPFTMLAFHPRPNNVYPYSHVSAGLGELKWINWAMSFLASKVRTSCTTIIGVAKGWDETEKKKALNPGDNRVVEIDMTMSATGKISDLISFIQNPQFHPDIYNVLERVVDALDKRWGTSEILYGQAGTAQSRSATDVSVRQQNSSIRMDDMSNTVQEAMTAIARKEGLVCRWLLDAQNDVLPILGQQRAMLWAQLVQSADVETIVRELEYRIESGSMAKPNTEAKLSQFNEMAKALMPFLQQVAISWQEVGPWNAFVTDWCKAMGLDVHKYMIEPPPPPPMPEPPPGQQPQGQQPQGGQPPQQGPRPGQHGTPQNPPRQAA